MNVYTVHDLTAQFYLPPFFAQNDAMANRMFIASLGDSFPFRSDFALFAIGSFDDETGVITPETNRLILQGHSINVALDPRPRPLNSDEKGSQ